MTHCTSSEHISQTKIPSTVDSISYYENLEKNSSDFIEPLTKQKTKNPTAFKINLYPGKRLSKKIKERLKNASNCSWNSLYSCYVGPIQNLEIAKGIVEERGEVVACSIELPITKQERKANSLLNKAEVLAKDLLRDEESLRIELDKHGYDFSYFLEPSEEQTALEQILCKKVQAILFRKKELDNLRENAREIEAEGESQKAFLIKPGETHLVADKGIEILSDPFCGIFQRLGRTVRIVEFQTAPGKKTSNILRPSDSLIIEDCDEISLINLLNRNHSWEKFDARKKESRRCDFPFNAAKMILSMRGKGLPFLKGFVCCPTIREDGSLLETPGYDEESGIFFDSCGTKFRKIQENPERGDAEESLKLLLELLKDFPFEDDLSLSVALSELITAVIRRALDQAPAFANDAAVRSSGKTLLAKLSSLIATGKDPTLITPVVSDEEMGKRLGAAFMSGDPILCIDNLDFPFESRDLCTILTASRFNPRILGKSKTPSIETNSLVVITGNNIVLKGDLCTRVLKCRLLPKCESPEERSFDRNLEEYTPRNRGTLVASILTIVRAFIVANFPGLNDLSPFRNYATWTKFVRAPLVWLGLPDPYLSAKNIKEDDPERTELEALCSTWYEAMKHIPVDAITLNHLVKIVENPTRRDESQEIAALHEVFLFFAPDKKGGIDVRGFGYKLRKFRGRIIGGFQVVEHGKDRNGVAFWKIQKVN